VHGDADCQARGGLIKIEAAGMNPMDRNLANGAMKAIADPVEGGIAAPPVILIELDDVPALSGPGPGFAVGGRLRAQSMRAARAGVAY
jgi:hypothetical protein